MSGATASGNVAPAAATSPVWILFRRELRGKKMLFALSALVMTAATATLTLVLSLTNSFETTYTRSAKTLIGGDYSLRLSQREFRPEERAWLIDNSADHSEIRAARVLAVVGERAQLVRLKGIDRKYPLVGEIDLLHPGTKEALFEPRADGAQPVFIGSQLAALLSLTVGDRFTAGGFTLHIVNIAAAEPDPDPRIWAGAPLVLVAKPVLESESFMLPGALVSRYFRVLLPADADPEEWKRQVEETFPDAGWRLQSPDNAQSSTRRAVDRIRAFLALASLAAILLAGIGCGNSLSAFLRARLRAIAVIKMSGGDGRLVQSVYLLIAGLFAIGGALIGSLLGMSALFVVAPLISPYLPLPLQPEWSTAVLLRALFIATAMTAAFAIPPVLRFSRTNPLTLFAGDSGDHTPPPTAKERWLTGAAFVAVTAVLPLGVQEKIMLFGIIAIAALLYGLSMLATAGGRRLATRGPTAWRLGVLAVVRNRRQTAGGVVSFGVGVFVLVAILNSESNFTARLDDTLKQQAPAIYLVGAQPNQIDGLATLTEDAGGRLRTIPFLRGRISAIGGRSADDIAKTATEDRWILRGDRGLTWTDGSYIGGSRVVEGVLWDDRVDGLQASFDEEAAVAFGIGIGDTLELNILGEPVTAIITSLREIDWQTLDINFVILLSDAPFEGVPHTYMGGAYLTDDVAPALQLAIGDSFPNIVPIATAPIFRAIKNLLARGAALLQATAIFLLVAGLPMILATLIENRQRRWHHATTLRLLGASRRTIIFAGVIEFTAMAVVAVLPSVLLGTVAGRILIETVFELEWQAQWGQSLALGVSGLIVFLILGAGDIARAAALPPLALLRNE